MRKIKMMILNLPVALRFTLILVISLIPAMLLLVVLNNAGVFNGILNKDVKTPEEDYGYENLKPSKELDCFLPFKPFVAVVDGTTPYRHLINLDTVYQTKNAKTYKFNGSVADMSKGKREDSDFEIDLRITVTPWSIIQEKNSKRMIDSEFDKITLLKLPLKKGNFWEENALKNGKKIKIISSVTGLKKSKKGDVITVEYRDTASDYYEKRKLKQGVGVIYFEKMMDISGNTVIFSYLTQKVNNIPIKDYIYEPKYETDANGNLVEIRGVGSKFYGKTAPVIKRAITDYDKAWERYVNEDDKGIYERLVRKSPAYNGVKSYDGDGYKQKFKKIVVKCMSFPTESSAFAVVYENIEKRRGKEKQKIEYYLKYKLKKTGGKWKIESYSESDSNGTCE